MKSLKDYLEEAQARTGNTWITTWKYYDPVNGEDDPSDKRMIRSPSRPTPSQLAKAWGGAKGRDDGGYWAYAGRCFEFADQLYHAMGEVGYKGQRTMDSEQWLRSGRNNSKDFKEILMNNMHAWIVYKGMHYDSMNPDGVDHPSKLKFFNGHLRKTR